jgi:uncharacterized repeat protein (TIGR02543 family)
MATYFVRTDGNDANTGLVDNAGGALLTLTHADLHATSPGDIVTVHAGTYNEKLWLTSSGSSGGGYITYQAYPGETVVISGAGLNLNPYSQEEVDHTLANLWSHGLIKIKNLDYIKLDGFEIYDADIVGSDAVSIVALTGESCDHITIQNCKIHKSGRSGVETCFSDNGSFSNITVYNCEVYDTNYAGDQEAISFAEVAVGEISYCTVHDAYLQLSGYRQQGIDIKDQSSDVLVHHNEVYGGLSNGILVDCVSVDIYNNYIHDITGSTLASEGLSIANETGDHANGTVDVYNNIFDTCGTSFIVQVPDVADDGTYTYTINLINNTIYNDGFTDYAPITFRGAAANYVDCVVRNNIISTVIASSVNLLYCANTPTGITIDHNSFYNNGYGIDGATYLGTSYTTSNPLMVDPANGNFRLQTGSPAVDSGSATLAPATDYDGYARPQGLGYNMGAFEFPSAVYTVTYNGNTNTGGTVPTDSNNYVDNAVVTVLGNTGTLVKTGYTFGGWNTAANGSGTTRQPGTTFNITASVTLYAKWTAESIPEPADTSYLLRLSDGSTTIDFYSAEYRVNDEGLTISAPDKVVSRMPANRFTGEKVSTVDYKNRTVTIVFKILGSSLVDVQAKVEAIEAALNDAQERYLSGNGTQYYIEHQWDDSAASRFYDVILGRLDLDASYYGTILNNLFMLIDCKLMFECEPFARLANQDIATETIYNVRAGGNYNYQDIMASTIASDVPAKAYIKLTPAGATGGKNTYIAKRSGSRYSDSLWKDGEADTSVTNLAGGSHYLAESYVAGGDLSEGSSKRITFGQNSALSDGALISKIRYTLATPPLGSFRVLVRAKCSDVNGYHGMGWNYGGMDYTPALANGELIQNSAINTWDLLDLGRITIPPIQRSSIATTGAFSLDLYQAAKGTMISGVKPTGNTANGWSNPTYAYDSNEANYASYSNSNITSPYLEFAYSTAITCNVIGFIIGTNINTYAGNMEVDVYYSAGWHNVYTNNPPTGSSGWLYAALGGDYAVSAVRIRFIIGGGVTECRIYEVSLLNAYFDYDYIFLGPTDEGYAIVSSGATEIIALDGISDNPEIYIVDSSNNILNVATAVGAPFSIGRENTRIYVLRDDAITASWSSDVKYVSLLKTI